MKKSRLFFLLILALSFAAGSCKHQSAAAGSNKNTVAADDAENGLTIATAVVIQEKTESDGVAAEYVWLRKHYPGYTLIKQSTTSANGKMYDKMDIKTADGSKKTIYFDITGFFGKF